MSTSPALPAIPATLPAAPAGQSLVLLDAYTIEPVFVSTDVKWRVSYTRTLAYRAVDPTTKAASGPATIFKVLPRVTVTNDAYADAGGPNDPGGIIAAQLPVVAAALAALSTSRS